MTFVHCGQTVGRIKMKLGMEVGVGPVHIVLDGDPAPPPQRGTAPVQFSAHVCCAKTAGWIKMPLGGEVGIGPGTILLYGDPAPLPKYGHSSPPPLFGPCLLLPNGWMDQDATWYGGRPRPRPHCARWWTLLPPKKGHSPQFLARPLWPNSWMDQDATWYEGRPRPRPY